jgi:hypothetical protein
VSKQDVLTAQARDRLDSDRRLMLRPYSSCMLADRRGSLELIRRTGVDEDAPLSAVQLVAMHPATAAQRNSDCLCLCEAHGDTVPQQRRARVGVAVRCTPVGAHEGGRRRRREHREW